MSLEEIIGGLPLLAARSAAPAAAGALLGLDYIAVGQTLLAQPAITGPIVGAVLGEPALGVWVGLVTQLLWAGQLPVGAYVPPNGCVAAVFTVGAASLMPDSVPAAHRVVLAGLPTIPVAYVAGRLDVLIKARLNVAYLHAAERRLELRRRAALGTATAKGVLSVFLKDFVVIWASVFAAAALLGPLALRAAVEGAADGLQLAYRVLPAAGIALYLRAHWSGRTLKAFAVGVAFGVLIIVLV